MKKIETILENITDRQILDVNIISADPAEIVIIANEFYFVYDKEYCTFEEYLNILGENHDYINKVYNKIKEKKY